MTPASLEGQTLGKYRVLESLGRGGMARVYRAYHPQLDRYVAIKVLRSDLVEDETFLARFRREAQAIAALRHSNIIHVFDFDVQDDIYYMVMELLTGDTLKARLNDYRIRDEQMAWGEMARILLDVLDGLAYAHSEGMVHRDIKPANILLTERGQAVIADFGIAHIVGGTQYTVSGALMGTLNYMAPEQGLEAHSDVRSDIYSLGIIFYEMLTKRPPFDADTPLATLMKHLNDPLPLPRQANPNIPESFERVVLKALAKEPEDRYQSAEEMAQALGEAIKEAEIELPKRISLPLSFSTDEAPSESVAVLSGSARQKIADAQFAEDETAATLDQLLTTEGTTGAGGEAPQPQPPVETVKKGQSQTRRRVGPALLKALGILSIGNLIAVTLSIFADEWALYEIGWPLQLFLCGWGASIIMIATGSILLFIPAGILIGNGIIFAYSSLTGYWEHWNFLWIFELCLVVGVIGLTLWLAGQPDRSRRLSQQLGRVLGRVAFGLSILVMIIAIIVG